MTSRHHLTRESSRALVLLFALVISPGRAAAGPPARGCARLLLSSWTMSASIRCGISATGARQQTAGRREPRHRHHCPRGRQVPEYLGDAGSAPRAALSSSRDGYPFPHQRLHRPRRRRSGELTGVAIRGNDASLAGEGWVRERALRKIPHSGPDNNPFGERTPHAPVWNYFFGFLLGAPNPIDTTAGGVAPWIPIRADIVPDETPTHGMARIRAPATSPTIVPLPGDATGPGVSAPGFSCLEQGGIFVRNQRCASTPPSTPSNFASPAVPSPLRASRAALILNGYYVSPLVVIDATHLRSP